MDKAYPPEAWKRLGKALEARRGQLGYGFRQREAFLADRGGPPPSAKTLARLERGERSTYPDSTVTRLESLYGLAAGSFEAILAGGDLEPLPPAPGARPLQALPGAGAPGSPSERALADLVAGYPEDEVIAAMAAQRRKDPAVIVAEIYRWLDFLAAQGGRGENGASAGLPGEQTFRER